MKEGKRVEVDTPNPIYWQNGKVITGIAFCTDEGMCPFHGVRSVVINPSWNDNEESQRIKKQIKKQAWDEMIEENYKLEKSSQPNTNKAKEREAGK